MQSFAYKVKSELCRQPVSRQCCARAEAYGVLLFCNTFSSAEVRIITENPEFAGRLPRLFQRAFSLNSTACPMAPGTSSSSALPGRRSSAASLICWAMTPVWCCM